MNEVRGWSFVSIRQLFISSQLCPSSPWIFFLCLLCFWKEAGSCQLYLRLMRLEMLNVLYSMKAVQTLLLLACLDVRRFIGEKMKNTPLGLCCCVKFSFLYGYPSVQRQKDRREICVVLFLWQNKTKIPKVSHK